jgi:hypothetical protein
MSIKKFFIGMAILLSVSLFVIGCPTEAEDGTTEYRNSNSVYGSVTVEKLQAAIDAYDGTGTLTLDAVTVTGSGTVYFRGKSVNLNGTLTTAGTSGNAVTLVVAGATVSGGTISVGANDRVVGDTATPPAYLTLVAETQYLQGRTGDGTAHVDGLDELPEGNVVVVENYKLGTDASKPLAGLTVVVYGTLAVNASSVAPTGASTTITAIGKVEVTGTVATGILTATSVNVSGAVISPAGTASVALPATLTGYRFALPNEQDQLTVTGTTSFGADVRGNGTLVLAAVTVAQITGTGRIQFSAATTFSGASSIETGDSGYVAFLEGFKSAGSSTTIELSGNVFVLADKNIEFGHASGTVTLKAGTELFTGTGPDSNTRLLTAKEDTVLTPVGTTTVIAVKTAGLEVKTAGITFDGPVDFAGDLTLTAVPATFKGNVSFVVGKKIVMTTDDSIITLGPTVYLGTPTASGVPVVYGSVIRNPADDTDNVTLTPAADTKLTFTAARTITQESSASTAAAHGIEIGGAASLPAGATYIVASAADTVGTLTLANNAELLVADGVLGASDTADTGYGHDGSSSKLVLTGASGANGAKLDGAGSVKAGTVTIVGGTAGTASWQAVTGDITIEADTITAASSGVLTATGGTANPSITVAAAGTLTIAGNTEIALKGDGTTSVGSIVLTYNATAAKIVFAAAGAKISTAVANATTPVTASIAGSITANSGTVGSKLVVTSTAATGNSLKLGSIAPAVDATFDGTDNVISGPTGTGNTTISDLTTVTAAG